MGKTRVVNLQNEPYEVYIGRDGKGLDGYFGNPFRIGHEAATRQEAISMFRDYFLRQVRENAAYRERVLALKGKVLGCFCKPKPCHGDIIVEWLESQP